jgi:hypothetical protein
MTMARTLAAVVTDLVGITGTAHAEGTVCSRSWPYITFAQTGLNVEPGSDGKLYAWGTRKVDPSNQQVQFC